MTASTHIDPEVGGGTPPTPARRSRWRGPDLLPYALVAPLAVFIIGLALLPAGLALVQSFYRVQELNPPVTFAGLDNFRRLFTDDTVLLSMGNTLLYVVVGVTLSTVLGIAMAVTLRHPFRGRSVLIAILVLPWALPGVVEGIVWTGIWDSNSGLLNSVLSSLHLISDYHVFLGNNRLLTIFAIQLGPWASFRRVTLPLIRPGITIAMVQALIQTLNVFDQPYVLNGSASTGTSVTMQTYFISFQNLDFGEGYALSLVLTITTLVISLGIVKLVYRPVEF